MYEALLQIGAGGLVVFTVILFLRHLREQRDSFLETINNHLTHVNESMTENTNVLTELKNVISGLRHFLSRNGEE